MPFLSADNTIARAFACTSSFKSRVHTRSLATLPTCCAETLYLRPISAMLKTPRR
ncbi:TPA: hypothetical protein ACE8JJ_001393 [Neisseria gonorrhoeae]